MKWNSLLISVLVIFLCSFQASTALAKASTPMHSSCDPPAAAWISNLTLTSFDFHWTTVPNAVEYQISAWVNNTMVFSSNTPITPVTILLPAPLQAGDLIRYQVATLCDNGWLSHPLKGDLPIIATEDVVMVNPGGQSLPCDQCPFTSFSPQLDAQIYLIYDCYCFRENEGNVDGNCLPKEGAIDIRYCGMLNSTTPTLSRSFYPNPFSNQLQAVLYLPEAGIVDLVLLNHQGQEVRSVINGTFYRAGALSIEIDVTGLDQGIYYYALTMSGDRWLGRLVRL